MRWLLLILMLFSTNALADTHFNSRETGCVIGALNPDYLMCDDFENDADDNLNCMFYTIIGKDVIGSDPDMSTQKGWYGSDFFPLTNPTTFFNGGVLGSSCASWSQPMGGTSQAAMAEHNFTGGALVDEVYFRYYMRVDADHEFGGEKIATINGAGIAPGGIRFGGFKLNCSSGIPQDTGHYCYVISAEGINLEDTSGNPHVTATGTWWFIEGHVKLETSAGANDGVLEGWMDNCGVTGSDCTGSPTLRFQRTDVDFGRIDANDLIGNIHFESWTNPQTTTANGERKDNIIVSRTGPIGFSGAAAPTFDTVLPFTISRIERFMQINELFDRGMRRSQVTAVN